MGGEVAEEELGALGESIRAGSIAKLSAFVFRDARSLVRSLSSSSELSLSSPPTALALPLCNPGTFLM